MVGFLPINRRMSLKNSSITHMYHLMNFFATIARTVDVFNRFFNNYLLKNLQLSLAVISFSNSITIKNAKFLSHRGKIIFLKL